MELGKRVLTDSFGGLERLNELDDDAIDVLYHELYESDYEMSDAELGEPSESPNVTLSEIYEEVLDMKAMIGRLIRNGEES